MYVVPKGGLPWKRRRLQQPAVGDLEQRQRSCAVQQQSKSCGSKSASSHDVCASPVATSFKLACSDPSELHQAVGMLAPRGRSQAGPTPTQEIALKRRFGMQKFSYRSDLGFDCISKGSSGGGQSNFDHLCFACSHDTLGLSHSWPTTFASFTSADQPSGRFEQQSEHSKRLAGSVERLACT